MRGYLNIIGKLSYPIPRLKPLSSAIKIRLILFYIVLDASIPKKPSVDHFSMSGCSIFAIKTRFLTARASRNIILTKPARADQKNQGGKFNRFQLIPVEKNSAITGNIQTIISAVISYCKISRIKCYNLGSRIEIFS